VLAAVYLDDYPIAERGKVYDVRTGRCLPSKAKTERLQLAQLYPHLRFLRSEALSKRAGYLVRQDAFPLPPPDRPSAGHPPRKGEG
jgi:hypothetical protein